MTNYKTYKIDLSPEDEKYLTDRKLTKGITLSFQLSEAVKMYVELLKNKENENN